MRKPVHRDKVGDIGQRPVLSSGVVLPRVWDASCNWIVGNYTTLAPYLELELVPDAAGAREEFNAQRTKMGIVNPVVHVPGYGQQAVFNTDRYGDAVIIVLQGSEVITVEVTDTSKHAPSATSRMRMAKAITKIIMNASGAMAMPQDLWHRTPGHAEGCQRIAAAVAEWLAQYMRAGESEPWARR